MKISNIIAYQVYDSRGYPTVACEVEINNAFKGISFVPSGASTGEKEACELRDNIANQWFGYGVNKAIENINFLIKPQLIDFPAFKQNEFDNFLIQLDGTKNKSKLGANAILALSLSYCRACAKAKNTDLFRYIRKSILDDNSNDYFFPEFQVNVLNGGRHTNNGFDFQEIMIIPARKDNVSKTLQVADECFLALQKNILNRNESIAKGDEGGFSLKFKKITDAFDLLITSIKDAGYVPGKDVFIGIDVAASEFYRDGFYFLHEGENEVKYSSDELYNLYYELINSYPIVSIEDPFDENDYVAFKKITTNLKNRLQIVGDDLYCTNSNLLHEGIENDWSNAILIKLNQIGTLTECLKTIKLAKSHKIECIISHRSGETEDTFLVDLLLAADARQVKTGSFSRSERLAKYNWLITIDQTITKLK